LGRLYIEVEWEKVAISLKRVKIDEKLLWRAYRKSSTLFRTVPSPTPYGLLFHQDWGSKTPIVIISRTGEVTDFKFGRYIHSVHPNKSPLRIFKKTKRGRIQGLPLPKVLKYPLPGTGKATNFKFCTHNL